MLHTCVRAIHNEVINICVGSIGKYILNELLDNNKFYAMIAAKTADVSEQNNCHFNVICV